VGDPEQMLYVATISTLELARLVSGGTIELAGSLQKWVSRSLDALRCNTLELSHDVAMEAYALPEGLHKDPVDRMLVATGRVHHLTLLTADERILGYRHARTRDARQ
jgi:PIN domain nuclease of toxin-antitoxin system